MRITGRHSIPRSVRILLPIIVAAGFLGCTSPSADSEKEQKPASQDNADDEPKPKLEDQETSSPRLPAKQVLDRGISHFESKEYDQAIDLFCQVLSNGPRQSSEDVRNVSTGIAATQTSLRDELFTIKKDALYYRGLAFLEKGFPNTAVEDFNEALLMDRQDARIYVQRGRANAELSEWYRAVSDCTQAMRLNPNNGMAYYYRGWAYLNWDKHELAVADFREAFRLTPEYAEEAREHIGQAYQCLYDKLRDEGDQQKADAVYLEACEVLAAMAESQGSANGDSDSEKRYLVAKPVTLEMFETHYQEGVRLFENGNLPEAITEFNRSIQIDPDREEAYLQCGAAHLERGFPNTAIAYFKKAQAKGLKSSELFCLMAQAYDKLGEDLLVPRYATQAIMLDSENAQAYLIRGLAYLSDSEMSLARKDLQEAIRLDPSMEERVLPLLERTSLRDRE